jgi:uncharacterized protein (TIGR03437 family)
MKPPTANSPQIGFDRRRFLQLGLGGLAALSPLARPMAAEARPASRQAPSLVARALTTSLTGFPTLTPIFAASFQPGKADAKLVVSGSFADFSRQIQRLAAASYRVTCFTTIQNMNRTWFYAVLQPGAGAYYILRTANQSEFQQAFDQRRNSFNLVDFNTAWELGTVYYTGYWLASDSAGKQGLMLNQTYQELTAAQKRLANGGQALSRLQAFPQQDKSVYNGLFEPGPASALESESIASFAADVDGKFGANTLQGLAFDPVSGNLSGCFGARITPTVFVHSLDWAAFSETVQQNAAAGLAPRTLCAYPNAPDFDQYFAANLAPFTMGYAYALAKDGVIIGNGGGYARSQFENNNAAVPFTPDTRLNLASVSKAITGVTLEVLLKMNPAITLDSPFWPLIQSQVPNPNAAVKTVTLRNLATMKSGLMQEPGEGPIFPPNNDFWGYLNTYLAQPLQGTPGVTYYYDNTNFSILQGVIEQVSGMDYVAFATKYVLGPAGIDPSIVNATPDQRDKSSLTYAGPNDSKGGYYWPPIGFVGPAGWIASARELVKLMMALRGASLLPADTINSMFNDGIGWYPATGNFGTYYHHNGGLQEGDQSLNTCIIRLAEGYDLVVLSNSTAPQDLVPLSVSAFDSRGLAASDLPANAFSITTVVNGASYLPTAAPGGYGAIIGTNLGTKTADWGSPAAGRNLPIELNGVRVRVNSQFAAVEYVSPTQINFIVPSNTPAGNASIEVTTPAGGMSTTLQVGTAAPGLFTYNVKGTAMAAALFAGTQTYVGAPGSVPGHDSRPAMAGDVIELYGTGMGPTQPVAPDGLAFSTPYPAAKLEAFKATIGGVAATVQYAGLVAPGLYQVNVEIPPGVAGGDQTVNLAVSSAPVQPNVKITLQAK